MRQMHNVITVFDVFDVFDIQLALRFLRANAKGHKRKKTNSTGA
jgi:hypothetical protein